MKTFAAIAALVGIAAAQSVTITSPAAGSTVTAGSSITVQVTQNDSQSSVENVAVAILMGGEVLAKSLYAPARGSDPTQQPSQSFQVTVPSFLSGSAVLTVDHLALVGADLGPAVDTANVNLVVSV